MIPSDRRLSVSLVRSGSLDASDEVVQLRSRHESRGHLGRPHRVETILERLNEGRAGRTGVVAVDDRRGGREIDIGRGDNLVEGSGERSVRVGVRE